MAIPTLQSGYQLITVSYHGKGIICEYFEKKVYDSVADPA